MAQKIEVLSYEVKEVVSKKVGTAGQKFSIPEAQCVVHEDGGVRKVCILNLPKDHPVVKPGFYSPTFKLVVGFEGKGFAAIDTLVPLKPLARTTSFRLLHS